MEDRLPLPPHLSLVERAARRLLDEAGTAPSPAALGGACGLRGEASIDLALLHRRGMVTPGGTRSRIGEEYRQIKRPLLVQAFSAGAERGNLIMVTSSLPGEGKTFTTINLAMSMAAERDLRVVLVDADLSRPQVAPILGITAEHGLTDLLENEGLEVADVLLPTNLPNLSVIPAGRPHALGTELLASQRASGLFRQMAARYANRIVLFDTAPVLASTESISLAQFVGQVVMVVEAERTSDHDLRLALDLLAVQSDVKLLLNKVRPGLGAKRTDYY
jgi:receptor protein-tyrosine kinase